MRINIEPVAIGFNEFANGVELRQGGYILGSTENCKVRVQFFADTNLKLEKFVEIPLNLVTTRIDYQPIIDYVIENLGLTVLPPQPTY